MKDLGYTPACLRTLAIVLSLAASMMAAAFAQASGAEPEIAAQAITEDRYPKHSVAFPGGVTGFPDLIYGTPSGYRPLTLDVYLPPDSMPASAAGFPLVVHIHGTGWMAGHARHSGAFANFPDVLASLAAKGYVVASVNYRLGSEAQSPAAGMDIKTAIRWLRSKAADYTMERLIAELQTLSVNHPSLFESSRKITVLIHNEALNRDGLLRCATR